MGEIKVHPTHLCMHAHTQARTHARMHAHAHTCTQTQELKLAVVQIAVVAHSRKSVIRISQCYSGAGKMSYLIVQITVNLC